MRLVFGEADPRDYEGDLCRDCYHRWDRHVCDYSLPHAKCEVCDCEPWGGKPTYMQTHADEDPCPGDEA